MKTLTFTPVRSALTMAGLLSLSAGLIVTSATPVGAAPRTVTRTTTVRSTTQRPSYTSVRHTTTTRRTSMQRPGVTYRTYRKPVRRQVVVHHAPVVQRAPVMRHHTSRMTVVRRSVIRH